MVFPGALGDLLLALPALRMLRRRHDGAQVTLVVAGALRAFATLLDVGDVVADLDDATAARLFAGDAPPPWLDERPVLYSWLGATDEALRARATRWTTAATFLRVERGPDGPHAMLAYARMLGDDTVLATLAADGRVVPPASPLAAGLGPGPMLAMHRGAGAPAKRWTPAGFAAVANAWRRRGGVVVDVCGPAERDRPPLDDAIVVRDWALPDVTALLARADGYVGNDSGVSHLAGAVGTRGAVVFVTTAAHRWRPATGRLEAVDASDGTHDDLASVVERVERAFGTNDP